MNFPTPKPALPAGWGHGNNQHSPTDLRDILFPPGQPPNENTLGLWVESLVNDVVFFRLLFLGEVILLLMTEIQLLRTLKGF